MKMEIHTNSWAVRQIKRMIDNEGISFDYPIQRLDGQWNNEQKSDLIHTLAQDYPVPPLYFLKEDKIENYVNAKGEKKTKKVSNRQVLDGKQRLTVINSFLNNEFPLSDKTDDVYVEGEEFEVAGLYFDDLDEIVQDAIESKMLSSYNIDADTASDEQIEDMFFRMNNGTSLTIQQKSKALMGKQWAIRFNELIEHPFLTETSSFSKAQLRSEGHIAAFIQSMMMFEGLETQMSQGKIADYSASLRDLKVEDTGFSKLVDGLDFLYVSLGSKRNSFLKRVNVPGMILLATQTNLGEDEFKKWFETFLIDLKESTELQKTIDSTEDETLEKDLKTNYHLYLGTGSTTTKKVYGRLEELKKHHDNYLA